MEAQDYAWDRFRTSPEFQTYAQLTLLSRAEATRADAASYLIGLDSILSVHYDQERSSESGLGTAAALARARATIQQQTDEAATLYLQDLSSELDKTYRTSGLKAAGIIKVPLGQVDLSAVKYLKQNPLGLAGIKLSAESENAMDVDVDIKPPSPTEAANGHVKQSLLAIEKPKQVKSDPYSVAKESAANVASSSSLFKKKNISNINYGQSTAKKSSDFVDLDDMDAQQDQKMTFTSAHKIVSADRVSNGKPPLPAPSGPNLLDQNKKRKRTTTPSFLEDDEDDDTDSRPLKTAPPKKKPTLMHDVSRAVVKPKPSGAAPNPKDAKDSHLAQLAEEYPGLDPEIVERVLNEILDISMNVTWDDIAGLEDVKQTLKEMIILPNLHPEVFTGLRAPPRGLLLFGPPGNGKTMIAKAIATEAKLTFFSMSASTLCSKWIGEGEKTMRALFAVARKKAPSFIFIDEVDSILSSRGGDEHESSRRLKNEFLLQFDGATNSSEDRVTVMGATNRPFDLDDAARRRLPKRIYVPLPEKATRLRLLCHLLRNERHCLTDADMDDIAEHLLDGYSCSDIQQVSQQAAMYPVREKLNSTSSTFRDGPLRELTISDFQKAAETTRPSVDQQECKLYEDFASKFGSRGL